MHRFIPLFDLQVTNYGLKMFLMRRVKQNISKLSKPSVPSPKKALRITGGSFSSEIWKDVKGYEGLYQVSNIGRMKMFSKRREMPYGGIYRDYPEKIMSEVRGQDGYVVIGLRKNKLRKRFYVHCLVARAFIKKIVGKKFVNHQNLCKYDNRIENLEWCTASENVRHAIKNKGVWAWNKKNTCKLQ